MNGNYQPDRPKLSSPILLADPLYLPGHSSLLGQHQSNYRVNDNADQWSDSRQKENLLLNRRTTAKQILTSIGKKKPRNVPERTPSPPTFKLNFEAKEYESKKKKYMIQKAKKKF